MEVPVPSQTSERLCICVLGYYIVPVPSQTSERLCICVLGYYIVLVSNILIFYLSLELFRQCGIFVNYFII